MKTNKHNIEIVYEEEFENEEPNIDEILLEIENTELKNDLNFTHIINYNENYTVKELLIICEYYGFAKELKTNKFNKEQIISFLVEFESNEINSYIFFKRQNMWFYINELKNDKFMKKYVLW